MKATGCENYKSHGVTRRRALMAPMGMVGEDQCRISRACV
jgi:hypothetical protein